MDSRRDFLKKIALLSGAAVAWSVPDSIQRALAISPDPNTSFHDAEHIVILMQENRSFDHAFGMLSGVRGFRDPRVHAKPDGVPVWVQMNKAGESYAPFRLNMIDTSITWLGGLPHNWANQVGPKNDGNYDKWLIFKLAGGKLRGKPMTMGHYTRRDIPFYYALADAFTICDQSFCASLTGTTPNRLYHWTGTVRPEQTPDAKPHLYNEEIDYANQIGWETFPEVLEKEGISWKVYQNDIALGTGLHGDAYEWLANFGCNPLEFTKQFQSRFTPTRRAFVQEHIASLKAKIAAIPAPADDKGKKALAKLQSELKTYEDEANTYSDEAWENLPQAQRDLVTKAFTVNSGDPDFHTLEELEYTEAGVTKKGNAPKGDILYQFRKDVQSGNLPTVSWLVAPEHFSDHPASAWFGAWYVSETLDILTENPEVWKKTIFILNYDENDGYYDHVPPFTAPNPNDPETGKASEGVDTAVEFVTKEQDLKFRPDYPPQNSSIGLGYRTPLVVASPWTRGGCVCSEVFDHTSVLQFLEHFLSRKTGKKIVETNISSWRRTVSGDLTSVFQDEGHDQGKNPRFLDRNKFVESIYRAKDAALPSGFIALSPSDIKTITNSPKDSPYLPKQEPGTRVSCPLPYVLRCDGAASGDSFHFSLTADKRAFGRDLHGSPFNVYAYLAPGKLQARAYAVTAGDSLSDSWKLSAFDGGQYHVRVDGPNGFMREFKGKAEGKTGGSELQVNVHYDAAKPHGKLKLELINPGNDPVKVKLTDRSYGASSEERTVGGASSSGITLQTTKGQGWYDWELTIEGEPAFSRRFAGRVENGQWSISDPAMA